MQEKGRQHAAWSGRGPGLVGREGRTELGSLLGGRLLVWGHGCAYCQGDTVRQRHDQHQGELPSKDFLFFFFFFFFSPILL